MNLATRLKFILCVPEQGLWRKPIWTHLPWLPRLETYKYTVLDELFLTLWVMC